MNAIPKLSYEDEGDVHNAPTAVRTVRELMGMGYDVSEPDSRVRVDSANEVEETKHSPSAPALAALQVRKKSLPPVTSRIREVCESDSLPREPTAFANLQEMLDSVPPPPVSETIRPPRNVSGPAPRVFEGTLRMDRTSLPKIPSVPAGNVVLAPVVETPALVPEAVQPAKRGMRSEVLTAFLVVVGSGAAYFALHHFALLP